MRCGIFAFKKNRVWVWQAYCRTTGELVDWKCGNRSAQTLKKMLDRLEQLDVKVFFADNWEAYAELISPELWFRQKQRRRGLSVIILGNVIGVVVFVWKNCMVSISLRMIDLAVFLFARFHVNGSREEIWDLVHNSF